eukprot:45701_1
MSQVLSPDPLDFNKIINPLKQFYAEEDVRRSILSLIQFYTEEAFDNEDITNDWIPGDFNNCDGIDIFMESLNYEPPINSEQNKQILFDWFCHCLLPNIPQPSTHPQHATMLPNNNTTPRKLAHPERDLINVIANECELQLCINFDQFQCVPSRASQIANTFVRFCEDEGYIQIADLVADLEDIDCSFIIDTIKQEYPQYEPILEDIFDILHDIVVMMKYDVEDYFVLQKYENYPPFILSAFTWQVTAANWKLINKLCTKEIPSLFRNNVEEQHPKNIRSFEDRSDWALMSAKALYG